MEIFKVTTYSWDLRRPHAGYVLAQERPKDTLRSCLWLTLRSGSRGPGQSCQPPGWALRDHLSHTEARLAKTGDLWFPALKENYPIISWMLSSVRRDFSGHKWQRTDFIEFALHKQKQSEIANSSTSQPWGKGEVWFPELAHFVILNVHLKNLTWTREKRGRKKDHLICNSRTHILLKLTWNIHQDRALTKILIKRLLTNLKSIYHTVLALRPQYKRVTERQLHHPQTCRD